MLSDPDMNFFTLMLKKHGAAETRLADVSPGVGVDNAAALSPHEHPPTCEQTSILLTLQENFYVMMNFADMAVTMHDLLLLKPTFPEEVHKSHELPSLLWLSSKEECSGS